jgi:hypothetical protein
VRELCRYRAAESDWSARQELLIEVPQYVMELHHIGAVGRPRVALPLQGIEIYTVVV